MFTKRLSEKFFIIFYMILRNIIKSVFFQIKKTKIINPDINTILIPEMDTRG